MSHKGLNELAELIAGALIGGAAAGAAWLADRLSLQAKHREEKQVVADRAYLAGRDDLADELIDRARANYKGTTIRLEDKKSA